jgi:hypothetical protein
LVWCNGVFGVDCLLVHWFIGSFFFFVVVVERFIFKMSKCLTKIENVSTKLDSAPSHKNRNTLSSSLLSAVCCVNHISYRLSIIIVVPSRYSTTMNRSSTRTTTTQSLVHHAAVGRSLYFSFQHPQSSSLARRWWCLLLLVVAVHFDHASAGANTVNSNATCESNQTVLQVDLQTDAYPGETSWNVVDITNSSWGVLSKNDYSDGNTLQSDLYCLSRSNCYQFSINDSWGDGICCGVAGDGNYTVFYDDGIIAAGGEFGSSETSIRFGDGCPTQSPSVSALPTTTPSPSSSPSTVSPSVSPSAFPSTSPSSSPSWTPSVFLVVGVGVAGIVGALLFHKLIYARRRAAR